MDSLISYYLKEFDMLKDAHFQTSQKIISFFQYALLIFSAPIALLTSNQISKVVIGLVFIVIGIIEVFIIAYLSSLRVEALQYARQINRIRNVLYSNGIIGSNNEDIHNRKILFSKDKKPDYIDNNQFIFIVLALGVFSAFYFSFGIYKLMSYFGWLESIYGIYVIVILCGLLIMLGSYGVYICCYKR